MKQKTNVHELLMVGIMKTGHLLEKRVSLVLKAHDLTVFQYNILRILNGAKPGYLTVGEVKNRLLLPKSDLTRVMDRLAKKKLVKRSTCLNNRRQIDVSITPLGMEKLVLIYPEIAKSTFAFFEHQIDPEQVQQTMDTLGKLNKIFDEKH